MTNNTIFQEKKTLWVALAGNPNSGKTTVFNALTKLRQKVGNYPGVTVEKKVGRMVFAGERIVNILDLPGTYSLAVRSPDEEVARDVLLGNIPGTPVPDLVVCVVDASNLERNLYLVSQIQDLGLPIVVVLNMMDTAGKQGKEIDVERLARGLGVAVVTTVASREQGIDQLKQAIVHPMEIQLQRQWRLPEQMEKEMEQLIRILMEEGLNQRVAFSEALILIAKEDLSLMNSTKLSFLGTQKVQECIGEIRKNLNAAGINWRSAAIEARYSWIQNILKDVVYQIHEIKVSLTDRLDSILTHRIWGWMIFVGLMSLMFFTIFSVATYPMNWIDNLFTQLANGIKAVMPAGDLRDLMTDGVIAGVGGIVVFLPQILILFFFIGLLQDTGYMARAAFIMDRVMSQAGLHGKSFIPLLSSFACAIPGIMASRSIESNKDRLVTILIAPLMSCSARLPVYSLLIATFIPVASPFQKAGIMLCMYFLGIVGAFGVALILKKTLFKRQTPVLIMEMPPYRWPSLKSIVLHMWERSYLFLKKAGTIIFGLSIVLWALMTYPKHDGLSPEESLQKSFAGMAGRTLEPVIKPLGYDWRIGIGLIGSFAAREVFVSTMNIVFNIDASQEQVQPLRDAFLKARWPDGQRLFTPLVCISLMVFYVFAMQCLSTVAIVSRETNSWRWPVFQIFYMTGLAYVMAFIVFQGGRLLGW